MARPRFDLCARALVFSSFLAFAPALQAAPGDLDLVTAGQAGAAVGATTGRTFQAVSADGRYVLFRSDATTLVPNDTNGRDDLFVRDRQSGSTVRVNVNSSGVVGTGNMEWASLSGDGRYVVFDSDATNLVPNDTNGVADVFLRDLAAGTTVRVSVNSSGVPGNRASSTPSVSYDGRYVAFNSAATNFAHNVRNGIYVRDRLNGTTTYLKGTAFAMCSYPRISGNGRYVAFECSWGHPDWDGGTGYGKLNGYLYELATDRVIQVVNGGPSYNNRITDISADGRFVAYHTQVPVVAGDSNNHWDAYLWDRQTGQAERVSVSLQEKTGNLGSYSPTLSTNGRFVAFESYAGNLVPTDPNRQRPDIFVRDRWLGTTERVSVGGADVESIAPEISGDGNVVVFFSNGRLVPADTSDVPLDIYARELGATLAVSPTSLAFGTVAVGSTSAARTITLETNGTNGLQVSWVGLQGTNPGQFEVARHCPDVLRPEKTCTLDVTFSPTSAGQKSATLVVSSEVEGVLARVAVTGTGG